MWFTCMILCFVSWCYFKQTSKNVSVAAATKAREKDVRKDHCTRKHVEKSLLLRERGAWQLRSKCSKRRWESPGGCTPDDRWSLREEQSSVASPLTTGRLPLFLKAFLFLGFSGGMFSVLSHSYTLLCFLLFSSFFFLLYQCNSHTVFHHTFHSIS